MTTTDDARVQEIEARLAGTPTIPGGATIDDDEVCWIDATAMDVRYLLDRLKAANERRYVVRENGEVRQLSCEHCEAAESRIRELEGEITYLVKVGRCGGGVSGTSFDADGGFSYSNECSLPIGHTGFHAGMDLQNGHLAEWSDWRIRLERPAIGVYEVQEDGNGG